VELGETHLEPTKPMEIRLVPVDEALRMAREGEVTDGPSALALLLVRAAGDVVPARNTHSRTSTYNHR